MSSYSIVDPVKLHRVTQAFRDIECEVNRDMAEAGIYPMPDNSSPLTWSAFADNISPGRILLRISADSDVQPLVSGLAIGLFVNGRVFSVARVGKQATATLTYPDNEFSIRVVDRIRSNLDVEILATLADDQSREQLASQADNVGLPQNLRDSIADALERSTVQGKPTGSGIKTHADATLALATDSGEKGNQENEDFSSGEFSVVEVDQHVIRMSFLPGVLPLGIVLLKFFDPQSETIAATTTHVMNAEHGGGHSALLRRSDYPALSNVPAIPRVESIPINDDTFSLVDLEVIKDFMDKFEDEQLKKRIEALLNRHGN